MKIILLLITLLIAASSFAGTKTITSKKNETRKSQPDHMLIISFDRLRDKTRDVSMLKPVFTILYGIENAADKLHGKTLKLVCNKSEFNND